MKYRWGSSGEATTFKLSTSSVIECDIGMASNDTVAIESSSTGNKTLDIDDVIIKLLDAGGESEVSDLWPIITYDANVDTVDMAGFGNDSDNFDVSALGGMWAKDPAALSLTNDVGARTIYLTGLGMVPAGTIMMIK